MAKKRPGAASAHRGKVQPFSPFDREATALLKDIVQHLGDADFFTREDLIHLPTFQHVATITRYHSVCGAVSLLLDRGSLIAKSRTDLCLPAKSKLYVPSMRKHDEYIETVERIVRGLTEPQWGVMDVVHQWNSDQHLTTNVKRVTARMALGVLKREGLIQRVNEYEFSVAEEVRNG